MTFCLLHYIFGEGEYVESGCDVYGGPGMAAKYSCPDDRPDLMEAHLAQHKVWEESARKAYIEAKLRAAAQKAEEAAKWSGVKA